MKSGDTLTGVAQRYNIGLSDLAAANNLKTNSNLILGRTITIPANGTVSVTSTSNSTATSNNSKSSTASTEKASSTSTGKKLGNTVSYTVGSGDSLIGLARKYGVSTKELADMNNIAVDTMLQRGQRLTVPNR